MTPTFWIALGFTVILLVGMLASIVRSFREAERKEKEAYIVGYDAMKRALSTPYSGPNGEYNPELAACAFRGVVDTLKGDDYQKNSSIRGIRDALTEYEREFGAP